MVDTGSGGEYHFDSIVGTKGNNWNIDIGAYTYWNVGDKFREFAFSRGNIFEYEENGRLKLATPEQIELYDKYSEINKYNL